MNNNETINIPIPSNIDELIESGVMRAVKENRKKAIRALASIVAASTLLLFVVGLVNPVLASRLPLFKNVFSVIESKTMFPGEYSKYATKVSKSVSSNGIDITLDEILCDGESLYATFIVKNSQPFKGIAFDEFLNQEQASQTTQLTITEKYNKVSFSSKELQTTGAGGLDGYFLDDKTFVGMRKYDIAALGKKIPNEFLFETKFTQISSSASLIYNPELVDGIWGFKAPVKINKSITRTIKPVNAEKNGYSVDSIIVTPFELKVQTSNPQEAANSDYFVKVYDNNGNEVFKGVEWMVGISRTHVFGKIPNDCRDIRVEVYRYKYPENSTNNPTKDVILDKEIQIK